MKYSLDLKIRVVHVYNSTSLSYRNIALLYKIPKSSAHRWVKKYSKYVDNDFNFYNEKSMIQLILNIQKDKNNKINSSYTTIRILHFLKNSIAQNPFKRLIDLKEKIKKRFNIDLSIMTISKYLRIIGFSKKKVTVKYFSGKLKDHKLKVRQFKKYIKRINKKDIICLDETYINLKIYSNYGWSKINQKIKKYMSSKNIRPKKSILMAIEMKGIIDYKIITGSYNKINFYEFVKNLINKNNLTGKYLLMDNVSFHKCKELKDLIEKSGNYIIYIPPYSPEFNPIEEVFAYMKSELRNSINLSKLYDRIDIFLKKFKQKNNKLDMPFKKYYMRSFG